MDSLFEVMIWLHPRRSPRRTRKLLLVTGDKMLMIVTMVLSNSSSDGYSERDGAFKFIKRWLQ
jgi:hypothetical protein